MVEIEFEISPYNMQRAHELAAERCTSFDTVIGELLDREIEEEKKKKKPLRLVSERPEGL